MDKKGQFVSIASKFIEKAQKNKILDSNIFIFGSISEKKLKNVRKAQHIPDGEEILILFDDTAFGSAKEGMLFTTWGIRYKENGEWNVSWEDLYRNGYKESKTGIIKDHYVLLLHDEFKNDYSISREMVLNVASIDFSTIKLLVMLGTEVLGNKNSDIGSYDQFIEFAEDTINEMDEERAKNEAETEEMLNKAGEFAKNIFKGAMKNIADDMNSPHVWMCSACGLTVKSVKQPKGICPGRGMHSWIKAT